MIDICALLPSNRLPLSRPILCSAPCHYGPAKSVNSETPLSKHNGLIWKFCKVANWSLADPSKPFQQLWIGFHARYAPTITKNLWHSFTFIPFSKHVLYSRILSVKAYHQKGQLSLWHVQHVHTSAFWNPRRIQHPCLTCWMIILPVCTHSLSCTIV